MFVYIVALTLIDEQSKSLCQEQLKKIGDVAPLTEDGFLVRSNLKPTELRDYIKDNTSASRIFVTKVSHGAAWANVIVPNSIIKEWYSSTE